jgi:hypothetical protein
MELWNKKGPKLFPVVDMQLRRIFEHLFPQMLVPLAANIIGNDELEKFFKVEETQTTEEDVVHVDVSTRDVVMKTTANKVLEHKPFAFLEVTHTVAHLETMPAIHRSNSGSSETFARSLAVSGLMIGTCAVLQP